MKNIIRFTFVALVLLSCERKVSEKTVNPITEEELVKETILNTIAWAKDKDTSLLYSIIINDESYLEVHPSNTVVKGISNFKKSEAFWLDERFKHIGFETWDMHINFSQDGKVAWFYCMLNDINEWDGEPASWENTRWTGVLEKQEGKWKMVQMHFSKPN